MKIRKKKFHFFLDKWGRNVVSLQYKQQIKITTKKISKMETKEMTKKEKYEEAKRFVSIYLDFKGDKRTKEYKNLQRSAPLWVARLNNFAKQLGLPNYGQLFFEVQ